MYRVKFFSENLLTKEKNQTNEVFFDKIDDGVLILLDTQRNKLEFMLPFNRILCVIEELDE
jgi:hypothetical protein